MPLIPALVSFTSGTTIVSADVNADFTTIRNSVNSYGMFVDVAATVTVTHVFSVTQTFSVGLTVTATGITVTAGGITVTAGGITVTGNSTITGTLNVTSTISKAGVAMPDGTGTTSRLARWTGANTIAASTVTDDGTYLTLTTQPRARVTVGSATVTSAGQAISFTTATLNVGTIWAGGNPTRLTIPANAGGSYHFTLVVDATQTGASAGFHVKLRKNGATTIGAQLDYNIGTSTDSRCIAIDDDAIAADYYEWIVSSTDTHTVANAMTSIRKVW